MPLPDVAAPYNSQADLLESSAEAKRSDALEQLRRSLAASPEVTPTQALAAGILALVPTVGGYIAGRAAGNVPLSPHMRLSPQQLSPLLESGGAQGAKVGLGASDSFLESLNRQQDLENKANVITAQEGLKQADSDQARAEQYRMGGLNQQAASDRQQASLAGRRDPVADAIEIARQKKAEGLGAPSPTQVMLDAQKKAFQDPDTADAMSRYGAGKQITPEEVLKINQKYPGALGTPATAARSATFASGQERSWEQWERQKSMVEDQNMVLTSGVGLDPKLNAKRSEIKSAKYKDMLALGELVDSYQRHGVAITGPEAAKQAALASIAFSAARTLSQTGMRLEGKEQQLVMALSGTQVDISNAGKFLGDWIRQGGDFATQVQTVKDMMEDAFDAQLAGYGQTTPRFAAKAGITPWQPSAGDKVTAGGFANPAQSGAGGDRALTDEEILAKIRSVK